MKEKKYFSKEEERYINKGCISLFNIIALILLLTLFSCNPNQEPVKYKYTKKVIIAKRISDRSFLVAFNDGEYANIGFGWYSCVKVGDTVVFKHLEGQRALAYTIINPCKN